MTTSSYIQHYVYHMIGKMLHNVWREVVSK